MSAKPAEADGPASATDVLLIGAGPVGLTLACELSRHGLTTQIVDKLARPTSQSRAIIVQARTQEMLAQMGLLSRFQQGGSAVHAMHMRTAHDEIATVDFTDVDSRLPFPIVLPQPETERILTERLGELGVTVGRGWELVGLQQGTDGVRAQIRNAETGKEKWSHAQWVVGTDGAHSTVRHLVDSRLVGVFEGERFLLADIDATHDLSTDQMYTWFSPDGPVLLFPMRSGRLRVIASVHQRAGQALDLDPRLQDVQRILDERVGGVEATRAHWTTEFETHHAQVAQYRHGRVFLAGDAAHIHSPAGGQGMNTGMQDAFNLAWKLARTARGHGGELLLDSYHDERHPVAAEVLKFTSRLTQLGVVRGALGVHLRNRAMRTALGIPPLRRAVASRVDEVVVAYPASPVVLRPGKLGRVAPGDHAPAVADTAVQQELDAARVAAGAGHLVLTIPVAGGAPADDDSTVPTQQLDAHRVTVTASPPTRIDADRRPSAGGTILCDPEGQIARRYGLTQGAQVVIRPDGYVGAVLGLDSDVGQYFRLLDSPGRLKPSPS